MAAPLDARPPLPRPLIAALYALALGFILPSLLEFALLSYPFRLGTAQWRFGAVGLLLNSVLFSPLMGMTIAAFAAVYLEHRKIARTIAVLLLLGATILLLCVPLFMLDFLQLRGSVNPQLSRAFTATSIKALVTGAIVIVAAGAIGIGTWRAASAAGGRRLGARGPGSARTRPSGVMTPASSAAEPSQSPS
jgi:hypothetical protein